MESIISTLSSITSTLSTISSKVSTNTAYLVQIIALINALKRRSASIGEIIPAFIETNELFTTTTTTTTKGKQNANKGHEIYCSCIKNFFYALNFKESKLRYFFSIPFSTRNLTVLPDWLLISGLMDGPITDFLLHNSLFS